MVFHQHDTALLPTVISCEFSPNGTQQVIGYFKILLFKKNVLVGEICAQQRNIVMSELLLLLLTAIQHWL